MGGLVKSEIARAKTELEKGGDWERRNKLRVYNGLFHLWTRDYKQAATLFLEALATFTATELVSFSDFVFYTVMTSAVALDRATIRKKVIHSPEILSTINDKPPSKEFLDSYFNCQYQPF